jgi:integrase
MRSTATSTRRRVSATGPLPDGDRQGLRKGELVGLKWSDVDFDKGTLRVERQRPRTGAFGPTKSDAGLRTIGLNALAVEAFRAQRKRQAEDRLRAGSRWSNAHELVFTTSRGTSPTAWALWCAFADATTKAGVRPIRIHDLRHACATLLLTAGEELAVISKVVGHADYSTTLKVYAHLDPKRTKAAAGRIDAALGRTPAAAEAAV